MRRVTAELMGTSMGFTSRGPDARHLGDRAVGRRAPGPGDRPSAPFRGRHHHPRRAHDGPLAQGDREAAALRGRASARPASRASSSTTTSSTSTRWPTGSWSSTAVGSPVSSRPALLARRADGHHARGGRERRLQGAGALSAGRRHAARGNGPGMSGVAAQSAKPTVRRSINAFATTLGVADRHHRRLPAAVAGVHRLRTGDLPERPHLPLVRADDALLRDRGHAADDGHHRRRHRPLVPVDHGPRHGRLRVGLAGAPAASSWASSPRSPSGCLAGLFNGLVITLIGIPSLVVTIGTQFLFRGLALVLVAGKSYCPRPDEGGCLLRPDGRQASSASRWSSTGSSWPRSSSGCS